MPVIDRLFVQGTDGSTTGITLADASCTSAALTTGVDYFVAAIGNIHCEAGTVEGYGAELEARFGTTRLALHRWVSSFGQFNLGDSTSGQLQLFAVVTGDGASTLNMRVRSTAPVPGYPTVTYGSCQWLALELTELTVDEDYWIGDSASGDTAEVTTSVATLQARLVLITDPNGTPTTTVLGPGEPWVMSVDATDETLFGPSLSIVDYRTLSAGTEYTIRWEFDDSGWVEGDAAGQVTFTPTVTGTYAFFASAEADIPSGTSLTYRRTRVFVLRLDALSGWAVTDSAGNIQVTSGTAEGSTLAHNFTASSVGVAAFSCAGQQFQDNWADHRLLREGTPDVEYPPNDGVLIVPATGGVGGTDYAGALYFGAEDLAGAQTWRLSATAEAAGTVVVGRDSGNSTSVRTPIIALRLESVIDGSADMSAPAPTMDATGTVTPGGTVLTGTVAMLSSSPLMDLVGLLSVTRTGSITMTSPAPVMVVDGTLVGLRTGTVEMTAPAPVMLAYEEVPEEAVALPGALDFSRTSEAAYYPVRTADVTRTDDGRPSRPDTFTR